VEATGANTLAMSVRDAVPGSKVVVLATPWAGVREAIEAAGNLAGKVLVDATNPLKADLSGPAMGHTTAAGEEVARCTAVIWGAHRPAFSPPP
jgi:8-hydroxy-5-deazaflavin:NADPH oxidoreductase